MYILIGLGNKGDEYKDTRHNVGRMCADFLEGKDIPNLEIKKIETFMNVSGPAVKKIIGDMDTKNLIVVHDDLDMPIGDVKIVLDRGSGGHHGVDSIIKALGTSKFIRIRIGISPKNIFGNIKKIKGEAKVQRFVLSPFTKRERLVLDEVFKKIEEGARLIASDSLPQAMTRTNS